MIEPPPTPKSPLKAPAAAAIAASRTVLRDMAGILRLVTAPTANELAEKLRPLTEDPERALILCDVDGTLAPIVKRAEDAEVPERAAELLAALGRRYGEVACVSGRSAAAARELVGVRDVTYAGSHGAELLAAGEDEAELLPEFEGWADRVREFASQLDEEELDRLGVRTEDKGPIVAYHWRGAPDEEAAATRLEEIDADAEEAGLGTHWGRKVLEVRPAVDFNKGRPVREIVERSGARAALYAGDDVTDLDAFEALEALKAEGALEEIVRVGVSSDEGPEEIPRRADIVVDGVEGFAEVLSALAES